MTNTDTARCVRDHVHYMTARHPHNECPTYVASPMTEHVFLVALQVQGETREQAETTLMQHLPTVTGDTVDKSIVCWWVAEDDRHDRSDNDSAVFVHTGAQTLAVELLRSVGLTGSWNTRVREGGQFAGGSFEQPAHDMNRYEMARTIETLMAQVGIGAGDLDLLAALDRIESDQLLAEGTAPDAFKMLAPESEYEWHGAQEDNWERLRDHTQDEVERAGLLLDRDS